MGVQENIRRFRLDAGLTQEELADKIGVARSTITQWERGWTQPRMAKVRLLADVLGKTCAEIVAEDGKGGESAGRNSAPAIVPLLEPEDIRDGKLPTSGKRFVEVPQIVLEYHPGAWAMTVPDDSMDKVAPKGMTAVFDPEVEPTNGRVTAFVSGKRPQMRRWFRGGNTLMLVADSHEKCDDIVVQDGEDEGLRVLGPVVHLQSELYEA